MNLTSNNLRFYRLTQRRFPSFKNLNLYGSFLRKKRGLFKNFALRRMVFWKSPLLGGRMRLALALKGTRLFKLLIKNSHLIRRFYCDMRPRELEQ